MADRNPLDNLSHQFPEVFRDAAKNDWRNQQQSRDAVVGSTDPVADPNPPKVPDND